MTATFYDRWREAPERDWRWPNFSPAEIAGRGTGKPLINEPALDKLRALRDRLGKPLIVRSAYRSPEHNRAVGGATRSKHLDGAAFDIAIANHDPASFRGGSAVSAPIRTATWRSSPASSRAPWSIAIPRGEVSVIKPGDVQRMSAGTGVVYSEHNASKAEPVHLLQIWIMPDQQGLKPGFAQQHFDDLNGKPRLMASNDERDGSISIHADVDLCASKLDADAHVDLLLQNKRGIWVQVVKGLVTVNDQPLESGDGLALAELDNLAITALENSEFLLFDMALYLGPRELEPRHRAGLPASRAVGLH